MNLNNSRWLGHAACFLAYSIFGFNIIVCKSLTSSTYLSPMGIFLLRSVGAGAIFWVLSLILPHETVARRDLPKIFVASLLGFFLTQLLFLAAIPLITPMESSIMSSLTPIYTMFVAAVAVREPITVKKAAGVLLSLSGVLYLILGMKTTGGVQQSSPIGI
ncbi:MAG: DMT family transporter, partial [Muribaculaceae bacterium]|nr:DMT family transporter [Muribaculaceae bacterium]